MAAIAAARPKLEAAQPHAVYGAYLDDVVLETPALHPGNDAQPILLKGLPIPGHLREDAADVAVMCCSNV